MSREADADRVPSGLRPKMAPFNFNDREHELRSSAAEQLPLARTANLARRLLAATSSELRQRHPTGAIDVDALDATTARQFAVTGLGFLSVRAAGSAITLISSGYEPEAFMPRRVITEALIRAHELAADPSGRVARKLLRGHSPSSLKSAAHKHGRKEDIEFLDHFAHADLLALEALVVNGTPGIADDGHFELRPMRGLLSPNRTLLQLARDCLELSVLVCVEFKTGLVVPHSLSEQLTYYRDNPLPEIS